MNSRPKFVTLKQVQISMSMWDSFKQFLFFSSFLELAVAFVLGLSFKDLVYAFIADWVTPFFAAMGGEPDFNGLFFTINDSRFMYGHFFNVLFSTLVLATVVFFGLIYPLDKYKSRLAKTKICKCCCSDVPSEASKCKYCCSSLECHDSGAA